MGVDSTGKLSAVVNGNLQPDREGIVWDWGFAFQAAGALFYTRPGNRSRHQGGGAAISPEFPTLEVPVYLIFPQMGDALRERVEQWGQALTPTPDRSGLRFAQPLISRSTGRGGKRG
jgi:hypothetical protein